MITVIVPVYNAEKTINRCIDSILRQTFTDFELLLINDGSTDRSGDICDEYAAMDSRICVFHKENGGVSSARNLGLDNAKGEWVTFIDSDDWLCENFTFNLINSHHADLLLFNYKKEKNAEFSNAPTLIQCDSCSLMLEKYIHYFVLQVPWCKFFNRRLIGNLRFDIRIKIGEDITFVLQYLKSCRSITYLDYYCYVWHEPDLSFDIKYKLNVDDAIYVLSQIFYFYKHLNINSIEFERSQYEFYRWLCSDDLRINSKAWFSNKTVSSIWSDIKYLYKIKHRIAFLFGKFDLLKYLK